MLGFEVSGCGFRGVTWLGPCRQSFSSSQARDREALFCFYSELRDKGDCKIDPFDAMFFAAGWWNVSELRCEKILFSAVVSNREAQEVPRHVQLVNPER